MRRCVFGDDGSFGLLGSSMMVSVTSMRGSIGVSPSRKTAIHELTLERSRVQAGLPGLEYLRWRFPSRFRACYSPMARTTAVVTSSFFRPRLARSRVRHGWRIKQKCI